MSGRYIRGNTNPTPVPIATAQAVALGDLVALTSGTLTRASDETWNTNLATTQAAFVTKFIGVSHQLKRANDVRVYGNSQDNRVVVGPGAAVYEFDCDSATFTVGQLVGPAKQTGNALEDRKVVAVSNATEAIGRVAEAGTSVTKVKVQILSTLLPEAK